MAKAKADSNDVAAPPAGVPGKDLDRLYGLPLEEFTGARNELAKELRGAGDAAAASYVKSLPKPSLAAWAVNQVIRTQRRDARSLLAAGERLRKAHAAAAAGRGGAERLREAADAEREAVETLVHAARGLLSGSGRNLSEDVLGRVAETFHAVALHEQTRALVQAGRLAREQRAVGLQFSATIDAVAQPRAAGRKQDRASDAALRRAKQGLERAEKEVRELRSAGKRAARARADAERALARAGEDEDRARSRLKAKEREIEDLRADLDRLR
jgi:hypothetical protein